MLREIGPVRQDSSRGLRRWFQDDYFDLFVWLDVAGTPLAFQLCYNRNHGEGSITWNSSAGFVHDRVDAGEQSPKRGMTPILRADGQPPYFRIYNRFLTASTGLPAELRAFLVEQLREYRIALYGTPRKPRRARTPRHC